MHDNILDPDIVLPDVPTGVDNVENLGDTAAEHIPVEEDETVDPINMPVDNGEDADLNPPTQIAPTPDLGRRRHTRRKADTNIAPDAKKAKLNEDGYWVEAFLFERTESYVQRERKSVDRN